MESGLITLAISVPKSGPYPVLSRIPIKLICKFQKDKKLESKFNIPYFRVEATRDNDDTEVLQDYCEETEIIWIPVYTGKYKFKVEVAKFNINTQSKVPSFVTLGTQTAFIDVVLTTQTSPSSPRDTTNRELKPTDTNNSRVLSFTFPRNPADGIARLHIKPVNRDIITTAWTRCRTTDYSVFVAGLQPGSKYEVTVEERLLVRSNKDSSFYLDDESTMRKIEGLFSWPGKPCELFPVDIRRAKSARRLHSRHFFLLDVMYGRFSQTQRRLIVVDDTGICVWCDESPKKPNIIRSLVCVSRGGHILTLNVDRSMPVDIYNQYIEEINMCGGVTKRKHLISIITMLRTRGINEIITGFKSVGTYSQEGHIIICLQAQRLVPTIEMRNRLLVFDYIVALDHSLEIVWHCCLLDRLPINRWQARVVEQGEYIENFAIDSSSHKTPTVVSVTNVTSVVTSPRDDEIILSLSDQSWVVKIDRKENKSAGLFWKLGVKGDFPMQVSSTLISRAGFQGQEGENALTMSARLQQLNATSLITTTATTDGVMTKTAVPIVTQGSTNTNQNTTTTLTTTQKQPPGQAQSQLIQSEQKQNISINTSNRRSDPAGHQLSTSPNKAKPRRSPDYNVAEADPKETSDDLSQSKDFDFEESTSKEQSEGAQSDFCDSLRSQTLMLEDARLRGRVYGIETRSPDLAATLSNSPMTDTSETSLNPVLLGIHSPQQLIDRLLHSGFGIKVNEGGATLQDKFLTEEMNTGEAAPTHPKVSSANNKPGQGTNLRTNYIIDSAKLDDDGWVSPTTSDYDTTQEVVTKSIIGPPISPRRSPFPGSDLHSVMFWFCQPQGISIRSNANGSLLVVYDRGLHVKGPRGHVINIKEDTIAHKMILEHAFDLSIRDYIDIPSSNDGGAFFTQLGYGFWSGGVVESEYINDLGRKNNVTYPQKQPHSFIIEFDRHGNTLFILDLKATIFKCFCVDGL